MLKNRPTRQNNLNVIRLIGASLVLYGHSFVFLGLQQPLFLSWVPLGPLGVCIFFTISGYLIAESWDRDPHLLIFFARRALRIFPGLIMCTLLSILILGPALTTQPLNDYFKNEHTWHYLQNIVLYISYYLPGVFETNKLPNAVNGTLWSLPVEFLMYIMVAIVGFLRGNRWTFIALAVISAAIAFFWAQRSLEMIVVYASDLRQVFIVGSYFWFGAVFYKFNLQRYFSISTVVIAVVIMISLEAWPEALNVCAYLSLSMVVLAFGLAYSPTLNWLTRSGDYSYGIYIYAFTIQQSIIYLYPHMTLKLYLLICLILTLVCAILSWHFIERPAFAFKPSKLSAS